MDTERTDFPALFDEFVQAHGQYQNILQDFRHKHADLNKKWLDILGPTMAIQTLFGVMDKILVQKGIEEAAKALEEIFTHASTIKDNIGPYRLDVASSCGSILMQTKKLKELSIQIKNISQRVNEQTASKIHNLLSDSEKDLNSVNKEQNLHERQTEGLDIVEQKALELLDKKTGPIVFDGFKAAKEILDILRQSAPEIARPIVEKMVFPSR
ncbi:MAG: hypothetical protein DHS20C02_19700 [Micavibrio sp.]|nr:MAG: hypothetical protein DHS20C02_19700 [Micavibrio sp.]